MSLIVTSWESLQVTFSPPYDDGGSAITGYGVEWFSAHDVYGILEVKTIKISNLVDGGSFTLTYNGLTYWYPISYDVESAGIVEVLESLPGIGNVTVLDGVDATSNFFVITFVTNLAVGAGNPFNPSVSSLGINPLGLTSSFGLLTTPAVVCQNGTVVTSGTLVCSATDSISATASLVNGSYSGSLTYPATPSLSTPAGQLTNSLIYNVSSLIQSSVFSEGFTFRVYAINQASFVSLSCAPLTLKPMGLPDVPTYIEVINVSGSDTSLNVYWTDIIFPEDRASPVNSFQIQWDNNSSFPSPSAFTGLTGIFTSARLPLGSRAILMYTINSLTPGLQYFVRVCSINTVGMSC